MLFRHRVVNYRATVYSNVRVSALSNTIVDNIVAAAILLQGIVVLCYEIFQVILGLLGL